MDVHFLTRRLNRFFFDVDAPAISAGSGVLGQGTDASGRARPGTDACYRALTIEICAIVAGLAGLTSIKE